MLILLTVILNDTGCLYKREWKNLLFQELDKMKCYIFVNYWLGEFYWSKVKTVKKAAFIIIIIIIIIDTYMYILIYH